jgi:hypothetical protein
MPTIYHNLLHSLRRVEDAISDVKELLQEQAFKTARAVDAKSTKEPLSWEKEWFEQVQSLLEMDAGWGLRGFWSMVLYNLRVCFHSAHVWILVADSHTSSARIRRQIHFCDLPTSTFMPKSNLSWRTSGKEGSMPSLQTLSTL